jgi:hypothetical protein
VSKRGRDLPLARNAAATAATNPAGAWLAAVVVTTFTPITEACSRSQQRASSAAYPSAAPSRGRQKVSEFASFQITTSLTSL